MHIAIPNRGYAPSRITHGRHGLFCSIRQIYQMWGSYFDMITHMAASRASMFAWIVEVPVYRIVDI